MPSSTAQNRTAQVSNLPNTDKDLIAHVVATVLRDLGYVEAAPEPEYMSDADIRRTVIPVSRSKWYYLMREPDFPPAIRIGKTNFRNVAVARAWMAVRQSS
jgi:hypothetical protein